MSKKANKIVLEAGYVRSVLVGVTARADFTETPALKYAIDLAANCGASLTLYVFAPRSIAWLGATVAPSAWAEHEIEKCRRATSATTLAASELVSGERIDLITEQANSPFEPRGERFVHLARTHDLAILDAALDTDLEGHALIEDTLFDSGRAVVVVPRNGGTAVPHRIAVAWDGSARAARAVKEGLPFLATSELVVLVTITGEKDLSRMAPGAELAAYLVRHGVKDCKLATLAGAGGDVATCIRLFVAEEDIQMIVMGAFVHSRFREAILGGVTRSLLDASPVPLLLAH
ncbi:universal stress protein [Mesorhizobium sp. YR577]|uniref:universal stress protein n=1 Tax=Mesorhizobium sp. YR577 TaxID=1884373 RepID=UPI0008E124A6|nr:universal stress protein [Mesorhizobium sp. YR577]SFU21394.1 Universal stress protein family protein [Mesorhizobium sp. YR577]